MEPGGFCGLQNRCDPTSSGRVGSIPIHSRQRVFPTRILHRLTLALSGACAACRSWLWAALLLALIDGVASAQRVDSTRAAVAARTSVADSLRPPISPRRAFFYSFLVPGYSQAVLGRHKSGALILLFEGICLSMLRESAADVREARRTAGDTVVLSWVDQSGGATRVTQTAPRFTEDDVRSRRRHEEDWIALLIANHLFAGADAYVAANLWDLPTQLSLRPTAGGATVVASLSW